MEKLELQKIANEVRKDIVTAVHAAKAGHPGGSLSAADLFTYLYFQEMNIDPKDLILLLLVYDRLMLQPISAFVKQYISSPVF